MQEGHSHKDEKGRPKISDDLENRMEAKFNGTPTCPLKNAQKGNIIDNLAFFETRVKRFPIPAANASENE